MNREYETPRTTYDLTHPEQAGMANAYKVLRNTYLLLAISLIPTIIGAIVGINFKFSFFPQSPLLAFGLFMAIAFGFMWLIERNKNSSIGVFLLLGLTFFMGLMLSRILQVSLSFSNGAQLIAMAAGGTGLIFFSLAAYVTVSKKDFSFLGNFLFIGLIIGLIVAIGAIFFQVPMLYLALSGFFVLLFSAYILYDVSRIIHGGETNYVIATLSLYLNIYNIFVSLLNIIMALSGERD